MPRKAAPLVSTQRKRLAARPSPLKLLRRLYPSSWHPQSRNACKCSAPLPAKVLLIARWQRQGLGEADNAFWDITPGRKNRNESIVDRSDPQLAGYCTDCAAPIPANSIWIAL